MPAVITPGSRARNLALAAAILGAVSVGCAPILVRLSEVGPLATAFWRLALAIAPLLALSAAFRGRPGARRSPHSRSDLLLLCAPGLFIGAELSTWHLSLHMTSVANATLIINLTPIFTTAIGWAFFGQTISRAFALGLGAAIAGVVVLKSGPPTGASGSLAGDATALVGAVFYAGYFLTLASARKRFATSAIMLWSTGAAALVTLPLALIEPSFAPVTAFGWALLVGLAWVAHVGGQGLVTFAIAWLPPTFSSLTMLIQPVVASALTWALLDERLTATQMAGGALVLAGILIARRG